jgi:hypothetical protein
VAKAIDEERAMMDADEAGHPSDQKSGNCAKGTVDQIPDEGREAETDDKTDLEPVFMLPNAKGILHQILHIVQGGIIFFFEEDPADMGMEKTAGNAVGVIVIVIHMFVMPAVVGTPVKDGIFQRSGTANQGGKPDRPFGFEGHVGKQAVVAQRYTEAGKDEHADKHYGIRPSCDLAPVEPEEKGQAN